MDFNEDRIATGDPSSRLVCLEQYGSTERKKKFVLKDGNDMLEAVNTSSSYSSLKHVFRSVFLPQGYPESVSEDYLSYQIWDTIQAFASSITGTLAAHAVLKGVGVGDESATVLAATMTWLLKDGAGMIGRIVFAWAKGTGLDCDAKRWRLFADFLNDSAIFLDILAPSFGSYFTGVVCVSGVCRSIVGVAGGATRAALTQHQARRNNMADVSAKDGSQETLVNLAALVCSLSLVPLVSGHDILIWVLYFLFTCLHLFANYQAVTAVCMESINQARLHFIAQHFLTKDQVPSVKEINAREPVLFPVKRPLQIRLGVSLSCITDSGLPFSVLKDVYERSMTGYLLGVDFKKGRINIVLSQSSDTLDQLQACFHAELLNFLMEHSQTGQKLTPELKKLGQIVQDSIAAGPDNKELLSSVLKNSLYFTESSMSDLTRGLHKMGWVTETALLGADEWRALWDFEYLSDKKD